MIGKYIIKHEAFHNLFLKDNDIFNQYFADVTNIDTLCSRIDRVSKKRIVDFSDIYPDGYNTPGSGLDTLKGHVFEIFCEILIKLLGSHNIIGIRDYSPVPGENDWGVDGLGVGIDDKELTVQIKYRSDPKTELTERDIKQFTSQSWKRFDVDINTKDNLVLISSCNGINPVTANYLFFNQIREINRNTLRKLVKNNSVFWNDLFGLIENTINYTYGDLLIEN